MEDDKRRLTPLQDVIEYLAGACDPQKETRIRNQLQDPASRESHLLEEMQYLANSAFRDEVLEAAAKLAAVALNGPGRQSNDALSGPGKPTDWSRKVEEQRTGREIP
jgi:hypothetical protein